MRNCCFSCLDLAEVCFAVHNDFHLLLHRRQAQNFEYLDFYQSWRSWISQSLDSNSGFQQPLEAQSLVVTGFHKSAPIDPFQVFVVVVAAAANDSTDQAFWTFSSSNHRCDRVPCAFHRHAASK